MSHPVPANYPCAGMAHSGVGRIGQMPTFHCASSTTRDVSPYAGNGASSCQNGTTYLQYYNGAGQLWANTSNTDTYNEMNSGWQMTGWIEYFWCPAADSSKYPDGINYSYGEAYPQAEISGNCPQLNVGGPVPYGPTGFTWGGSMADKQTSSYVGDKEAFHGWTICPGNYVYDYSDISTGADNYMAEMSVGTEQSWVEDNFRVTWKIFR